MLEHAFIQTIMEGGSVIYLLLAMSVWLVSLVVLKCWILLRAGLYSQAAARLTKRVEGLTKQNSHGRLLSQLSATTRPLPKYLHHILSETCQTLDEFHTAHEKRLSKISHDANQGNIHAQLHQLQLATSTEHYGFAVNRINQQAQQNINQLNRFQKPLELIANIAPLMGLLGTVIGMIVAFQALAANGDQVDAALLSEGIWQALLTTAIGIIIAIPANMSSNYFEGKVNRFAEQVEAAINHLIAFSVQAQMNYHQSRIMNIANDTMAQPLVDQDTVVNPEFDAETQPADEPSVVEIAR